MSKTTILVVCGKEEEDMQSKTDRVICGTCEFWTGSRQPIFSPNAIPKIDIIDKMGCCECPVSRFEGQSRSCDGKCVRFSKWTELF